VCLRLCKVVRSSHSHFHVSAVRIRTYYRPLQVASCHFELIVRNVQKRQVLIADIKKMPLLSIGIRHGHLPSNEWGTQLPQYPR
ncbi:hypothetical protein JMJ77_0010684, partial [Colletotrichum scovillei]